MGKGKSVRSLSRWTLWLDHILMRISLNMVERFSFPFKLGLVVPYQSLECQSRFVSFFRKLQNALERQFRDGASHMLGVTYLRMLWIEF